MPESTPLEADAGAYHQIHFAWAEPTLLGRVGPGPAATSLPERDQPVLRSWRDRLLPALTADYRTALPGTDPAAYPETLWAHHYPDGQSALVYRWPGDVRAAHAWAIVGPTRGLTLSRILALHENPNTRPAASRPPAPGWVGMSTLPAPQPWERTAAPGALRTRDRRAAETQIDGEPILVGAVARALEHPDRPVHITLDPDRADLWQAVQLRFLWGVHRTLHDVLTPRAALPADGWHWSFSTYDPVLGVQDGPHLAFGPPTGAPSPGSPFLTPAPLDHLKVADGLVTVLREEGGDALADHLRDRGVPEAATFTERRELLRDWFDPRPKPAVASRPEPEEEPEPEQAQGLEAPEQEEAAAGFGEAPEPAPAPERGPELAPAHESAPERGPGDGAGFRESSGPRGGADPEGETGSGGSSDSEDGDDLAEAPDPFEEEGSQDTAEQEAWSVRGERSRSGRARTFLGVARRRPPESGPVDPEAPEAEPPPEEPDTDPDLARPLSPPHSPPPPRFYRPAPPDQPRETWTISASAPSQAPPEPPAANPLEAPEDPTEPQPSTEPAPPTGRPSTRTTADAPPLGLPAAAEGEPEDEEEPADYAAETEPEVDEEYADADDNWPTQYVDLPLSRLERWHSKRGPEGAYTDVVDARAAVRAERAELQRVRSERDRYHSEVQELRREIARLDQSWIDADPASDTPGRGRRWPRVLLAVVLLAAVFAAGLEIGARTDQGTLDLLTRMVNPVVTAGWWPL
ncbi:hypothetical protein [Nocardiopsis ganjiahuensis]|uniref:hypothetical protein n=1 Tax=Nocardiopsis ganjiahuensis TaxID=239984 RepID=UPI00034C2A7F|nr:hypothetical protein [Nocardiopsis ganjiahuensis]